ncbi:MAG: YihY/virulence factor BrkB family protein [Bacteroidota bacterium]
MSTIITMKKHRLKKLWLLLKDAAISWDDDNIAEQGAALSFFTVFSLSPLLILLVVLSSIGFGEEAARGLLVKQIRGMIGTEAAVFVQTLIVSVNKSGGTLPAAIFSVIMLLLGASGVFIQLRDSLNLIMRVRMKPRGAIKGFLHGRLLAVAMIFGIAVFLIVILIVSAASAVVGRYLYNVYPHFSEAAWVLDLLFSIVSITIVFALLIKVLPSAVIAWKDVWIGASFTAVIFSAGNFVIGLYLGNESVNSIFGAARSLIIFMVWTYYTSQIFFFGAGLTRLYAARYGSGITPDATANRLAPH